MLLAALDAPANLAVRAARARRGVPALEPARVREVLVLRLDRIGDVVMCLPALAALRHALPHARIRLAVGGWSAEVARSAPVDEVLVWSAPWAGRRDEGALGVRALVRRARALRGDAIDLGFDLQGDVRAAALLRLTNARRRFGYANTGGAWLLTDVVPLDETVGWVEQNRRAVRQAVGGPDAARPDPLTAEERAAARRLLEEKGVAGRRPLVGIHPSGGRRVKQWDVARWSAVAARLQDEHGACIVITGSPADRPLATALAAALPRPALDLAGVLGPRETMALIGAMDLFLSPDTGPMHMACAVGTASVSVFGPSDPVRYFSGEGPRHAVVRTELWCAPCNLIRRPPAECDGERMPECLERVGVEEVVAVAARLLRG
jgi:ADP-heptose:LPS heptosyltransferase